LFAISCAPSAAKFSILLYRVILLYFLTCRKVVVASLKWNFFYSSSAVTVTTLAYCCSWRRRKFRK